MSQPSKQPPVDVTAPAKKNKKKKAKKSSATASANVPTPPVTAPVPSLSPVSAPSSQPAAVEKEQKSGNLQGWATLPSTLGPVQEKKKLPKITSVTVDGLVMASCSLFLLKFTR